MSLLPIDETTKVSIFRGFIIAPDRQHPNRIPVTQENLPILFYGTHWGLRIDGDPLTLKWIPEQEAAALKHLVTHVKEGLLEIAQVSFSHWNYRVNLYESRDFSRLSEQERRTYESSLPATLDVAKSNRTKAANTLIRLEKDLEVSFSGVSTFSQALSNCEDYLKGDLGVDWFVRDFFVRSKPAHIHDSIRNRAGQYLGCYRNEMHAAWEKQESTLNEQKILMERHLQGHPNQHFTTASLKPLMKRYPDLGGIYNRPD